MVVNKLSISFSKQLSEAVRESAETMGETLSGWLSKAAESKLRADALGNFLDEWEAENGEITPVEFAEASSKLHLTKPTANENSDFRVFVKTIVDHGKLLETPPQYENGDHPVIVFQLETPLTREIADLIVRFARDSADDPSRVSVR